MSTKNTQSESTKQNKELLDLTTETKLENDSISNKDLPNKRFTTLINPNLLSQIKLISYFTNKTLSQTINDSIEFFIKDFEEKNNTKISSIINLKNSKI